MIFFEHFEDVCFCPEKKLRLFSKIKLLNCTWLYLVQQQQKERKTKFINELFFSLFSLYHKTCAAKHKVYQQQKMKNKFLFVLFLFLFEDEGRQIHNDVSP
jgi:hypothetical protein